jgi:NADH:ubiquinone reductase (non-electrogenic)
MLVRPKAVSQLASTITARSLSASRVAPVRPSILSSSLSSPLRSSSIVQPALRRAYADAAAPSPAPKKRFRFFRWAYRLTVLSGLGLTGYLGYSIYLLRHPEEQVEPDPSKKTLVILGMSLQSKRQIK